MALLATIVTAETPAYSIIKRVSSRQIALGSGFGVFGSPASTGMLTPGSEARCAGMTCMLEGMPPIPRKLGRTGRDLRIPASPTGRSARFAGMTCHQRNRHPAKARV
jgi:hypothetical protein